MNYVVALIVWAAFLPGFLPEFNIGIAYLSVLRIGLLLLCPVYFFEKRKKKNSYIKLYSKDNGVCILMMTIWFVYSLIMSIWVIDLGSWMHMEYFLGMALWCTLFFDLAELSEKDFENILWGIQIIMIVHYAIGWFEMFTHQYFFATPEKVRYMVERRAFAPISMFFNLNDFALVIVFGMLVSIFIMKTSHSKCRKIISFLSSISAIALILVGKSRGCLLALMVGVTVYMFFSMTRRQKKMCLVGAFFLILIIICIKPSLVISIYDKLSSILALDFSKEMNSEIARVNLIRNGFVFLEDTFGFGVGAGNIEYWMEHFSKYNTGGFVNMHNWWMEILTCFGIGIFLLYIGMYLYMFFALLKKSRNSTNKYVKEISLLFLSWLSAFTIGSISSSNNFNVDWLWCIWALIIAFLGIETRDHQLIRS